MVLIEQAICDALGIHPKHVEVEIDENGDIVYYALTQSNFNRASFIHSLASHDNFWSAVNAQLGEGDSGIVT